MSMRRVLVTAFCTLGWALGSCSRPTDEDLLLSVPTPGESRASVIRRVHLLWKTTPQDPRGGKILELLAGLGDVFGPGEWWCSSGPVLHAWKQHRHNPELRESVLKVDDVLIAGIAEARDIDALAQIVKVAGSNAFDSSSINALLSAMASDPLPESGFAGSRQEAILAATILAGDWLRAKEQYSRIPWPVAQAAPAQARADSYRSVIDLCSSGGEPSGSGIGHIIEEWENAGREELGRIAFQPALERLILVQLQRSEALELEPRIRRLLDMSKALPGSKKFWETLITRSVSNASNLGVDVSELLTCARLVRSYGDATLETTFWKIPEYQNQDESFRVAGRYLALALRAIDVEDFDIAARAGAVAKVLAGRAGDAALDSSLVAFSSRMSDARKSVELLKKARGQLEQEPNNPQASSIVGRHLCLREGDWKAGLPLLGKGADLVLKAAAIRDLREPATLADRVVVADAWRDAYLYGIQPAEPRLLERAEYWYTKALASASAAELTEVQRRIASLPPPMTPVALLPMVDPKINTVYGTWARRAEGLISDSSDFARFEIPFYPPPEYDLEVEFSRLEGLSDLVFFLTHEGKSLAWTITGSGPDVRSWASIRNAWDTGSNPTRVNAPGWLENGRVSLCRIEVRRTLLRVSLDGKVLLEHRTTFEEMELPEWLRLRDPSKLGIGTYRSPTLIRRIQLLEIGARGRKSA